MKWYCRPISDDYKEPFAAWLYSLADRWTSWAKEAGRQVKIVAYNIRTSKRS